MLNKLPKAQQAKAALHEIWLAESRAQAEQGFDQFLTTYETKYAKATKCLAKDHDALLTFYDLPAGHWTHLRTTNPIESTFVTVRLRTAKTRSCVSRAGILAMSSRKPSGEIEPIILSQAKTVGSLVASFLFKLPKPTP